MRVKLFLLLPVIFLSLIGWHYDLDQAKEIAKKEHKHILLNFSGSDWCGPCIRMRSEIFESEVFQKMADTQLILVNADFPRMKKNQLTLQQQELNNKMADHYNSKGRFPFTLLLDENGKVLKQWDGLPNLTAAAFTIEVRNGIYGDR
jgi:thioredoxin-related protein